MNSTSNKNIAIGDYYAINLKLPPFSLTQYVEIFHENDDKYLILYDIKNYFSNKINLNRRIIPYKFRFYVGCVNGTVTLP